jgi:hypothetical protein
LTASVNRFYEADKCDCLRKGKRPPLLIVWHFWRRLDFVTASVNIWALPRKIICVVVVSLQEFLVLKLFGRVLGSHRNILDFSRFSIQMLL